jgi:lipopolysaccharide assembly outer membrane protein LptD (OstA)
VAGNARRLNEEQVAFTDLKITTFTPESQIDLQIDLRTAIFNLKTKILSSRERGTIKRADFNIVGDSLDFNTEERTGHMTGNIKMVITSNSKLIEKSTE